MIERLIAEATECDFKVALEVRKPKSWLKSVSAFANGIGGTLFFGVGNDKEIIGLDDVQADAESISRLIKDRITPFPSFVLSSGRENGKDLLVLIVSAGRSTPYYYKADGVMEAYIRMGNESVIAPDYVLNQLILKGMNRTYDALSSEYRFKDYAFSKLRERYKVWTRNSMEDKLFDSFEIRDSNGMLTNAGALLADNSPIRHSRLFCTRWNGLDKSGGIIDALDSAEYSGSLIILLDEGVGFVKRNMKTRWKKTPDSRIEMPEYCERSVFEALVNALIHRDYLVLGSEVHIDIYDDRLTIYSPGGMADGTRIQERDISNVSSTRRNPVLADIFSRLGYMERQGSGFKKIREAYHRAALFREDLEPKFYSNASDFYVTLYNLNYGVPIGKAVVSDENQLFEGQKPVVSNANQLLEGQKPVVSNENQLFDERKPVVSNENQLFEGQEPVVSDENQLFEGQEPVVSDENQLFDERKPVVSNENRLFDERKPVVSNENQLFEGQEPVVSDENRLFDGQEPVVSDENRLFDGQKPVVSNENRLFDERKPVVSDENRLFDEQESVVSDENRLFDERKPVVSNENRLFDGQKPVVSSETKAFETLLLELKAKKSTKETALKLFRQFGFDLAFARADIMRITGITSTPAGELIKKLKEAERIEAVRGQGKGKYKFIMSKE